ncbi:hypothetical protein [Salmonella enterica]
MQTGVGRTGELICIICIYGVTPNCATGIRRY